MDRISDSGSEDLGSSPDGVTKSKKPEILKFQAFFIILFKSKNS